jgi:hypothetical protein
MCHRIDWLDDGHVEEFFYPSPVSRKEPDWLIDLILGKDNETGVGELLYEVYQAVDGGQHLLAAMGIRAALEQAMVMKVGELRTFDDKLNEFHKQGYVSLVQRDAMRDLIDVGNPAVHRAHKPTAQKLKLALDIIEGVLASILVYKDGAAHMADKLPPRPPSKPR